MRILTAIIRPVVTYVGVLAGICVAFGFYRSMGGAEAPGLFIWLVMPAALAAGAARTPDEKWRWSTLIPLALITWFVAAPLFALAEKLALDQDYTVLLAAGFVLSWIVIVPLNCAGLVIGRSFRSLLWKRMRAR